MHLTYEPHRIYAVDESGMLLAEITFPALSGEVVDLNHTFVHDSLRGQGAADQLTRAALMEIEAHGWKVVPSCPYAARWFEKHPEKSGLLSK